MTKKNKEVQSEVPASIECAVCGGNIEKKLAENKKRVVSLTDVTVTREKLVSVLLKTGKISGNEIPRVVDQILKDLVLG